MRQTTRPCPHCAEKQIRVVNTKYHEPWTVWRYYTCLACRRSWKTYELLDGDYEELLSATERLETIREAIEGERTT